MFCWCLKSAQRTDPLTNSVLRTSSITAPLRLPIYRRSWAASLLSNSSLLILGVGASWAMTQMTNAPVQIALVQTAMMLPITIFALPAGAIADMYDRRLVGFSALSASFVGTVLLVALSLLGTLTPATLLAFCFIIAAGAAVFNPAWQASVNDQVPPEIMPAAVSLNSISYNIARGIGPALGGVIVAATGSGEAFISTAIGFIPMLAVLYQWPRSIKLSPLPPEGLKRAVISGVRYVIHSPPIRIVLTRTICMSLAGAATPALMPLIVRDQLRGDARMYGAMLGAFGIGAIVSSFLVPRVRRSLDPEWVVRICLLAQAAASVVVALSHLASLTALALAVCGAGWMMATVLFNVGVQLSSPRWVAARVLATFQATITGGMGIGGWAWGLVAKLSNLDLAIWLSAAGTMIALAVGLKLRMPHVDGSSRECTLKAADPALEQLIEGRSGPIIVEIDYRVTLADAASFYRTMLDVQLSRRRYGAYRWSVARQISNPQVWVERVHYPTWHDYLRQHHQLTLAEEALEARALAFHQGPEPVRTRWMLERPLLSRA
jgi:MFS family permease